ncbi:MAG: glycosyltransferase, partial [Anaerolineaceae bacterium]|nr:glycosyltransferase [Anaerolineaceae bacterium]
IPDRIEPLVLHAPSNRGIKGTDTILQAVEQLKLEGMSFDFRLIENIPNAELRNLLTESDILIDDIFSVTIGVLALEAMATGNAVLVRYLPNYSRVPPGCPAVNVSKDSLVDKLREVIIDRSLRSSLAQAGRPFVENHHDHVQIVQQIIGWLEPGGIQEYDFTPTFFEEHFQISSDLIKQERINSLQYIWQRLKKVL